MIEPGQTRRNSTRSILHTAALEASSGGMLFDRASPSPVPPLSGRPSSAASLVPLQEGLYALDIGEFACLQSRVNGLQLPLIEVSSPPQTGGERVEIVGASGKGETWLGQEGGTVLVKSPPGGGILLLTAYGPSGQAVAVPEVEVRRLDRPRANCGGPRPVTIGDEEEEEIATEIVLHMERLGDRRFSGQGWVGNRGKKLRIEAFSIRPIDRLLARDIEFKALGPNRRQTPWVTDAKLCGTRGQRLPLTGFAIRLAPHVDEPFDVIYEGAFFESGVVGPNRNGELCNAPIADDPLEAINVRLVRRPVR